MSSSAVIQANNKRILKNSFVLYVRMALTMAIGFFTTRELLFALGVVDFGLVNVIGSVVSMFSFLSGTLQATVSRFIASDLGRKNLDSLKNTFSLTLLIYAATILLVFVLAETLGLWVLKNNLVIALDRKFEAYIFFQFTVVAFIFNIASVPYSALVISHENMKAFSWITTGESIARLCIVYLLLIGDIHRLSFYGVLLALLSVILFFVYFFYCFKKYPESRFVFYWKKKLCMEMLSFAGWNLWGAISGLFSNVLVNILLNNYFGAIVNAARGIAMQGAAGVSGFVTNFLTATRPQIFKYYAEGDQVSAIDLTMKSSRAGYFLLFFFSLPVFLEMTFILGLWLPTIPKYADVFMRLILLQRLIEIMTYPLVTLSHAAGRVAIYQTVVGILQWLTFPLSWVVLRLGGSPESVFWVAIGLSLIATCIQFYLISRIVDQFSVKSFLSQTVMPVIISTTSSLIIPLMVHMNMNAGWDRLLIVFIVSVTSTSFSIFFFGLKRVEQDSIILFVKKKFIF